MGLIGSSCKQLVDLQDSESKFWVLRLHLKSSFFFSKRVKCHSRKWAYNANVEFEDCVLVKSFSHMYICVYFYMFLKCSFPNMISELGIGIATLISGLVLNVFWNRTLHLQTKSFVSSWKPRICAKSDEKVSKPDLHWWIQGGTVNVTRWRYCEGVRFLLSRSLVQYMLITPPSLGGLLFCSPCKFINSTPV